MPTPTSRETYIDRGENIDVFQVQGLGGVVSLGQTIFGQTFGSLVAQDNITAHAGGGQALAFPITGLLARITTVVTAGDSIVLPPSQRGYQIVISNDAAVNACNVFPAVGEAINALGANNPFSLTVAAGPVIFYCFSAGLWRTK